MKYNNYHVARPPENELIIWVNFSGKETYGWFRGNLMFEQVDGHKGYVPKWWRECDDVEREQYTPIEVVSVPKRRGRPPKIR